MKKIHFLLLTYPCGILLGLLFLFLRLVGKIKVEHEDRIPKKKKRMIIVPNHPSEVEPVFLPVLFFWEYVFNPISMSLYSTPDEKNWKKWYLFPFWPRFIFIPRGERRRELLAIRHLRSLLAIGRRAIIFGEGGRTKKGAEFIFSRSLGKRIRPMKPGVAYLATAVGATVLPVWIEADNTERGFLCWFFSGGRLVFRIGEPFLVEKRSDKSAVTDRIQNDLLKLADRG